MFEMTCRACGCRYEPSREDILAGPATYHRCPDCRPIQVPRREEPGTLV